MRSLGGDQSFPLPPASFLKEHLLLPAPLGQPWKMGKRGRALGADIQTVAAPGSAPWPR